MTRRNAMCILASTALLIAAASVAASIIQMGSARATDAPKYPDWKGQWERFVVRGST